MTKAIWCATLAMACSLMVSQRMSAQSCPPEPVSANLAASYLDLIDWLGFDPFVSVEAQPFRPPREPELRRHAWRMVASITQDSSCGSNALGVKIPIWRTWAAKSDVLSGRACSDNQSSYVTLPNTMLNASRRFGIQSVSERPFPVATDVSFNTLFNPVAARFICDANLNKPAGLAALQKSGAKIQFPSGTVTLKTVWLPVEANACLELPVWDGQAQLAGATSSQLSQWPRRVLVSTGKPPTNSACRKSPASVVPLSKFYFEPGQSGKINVLVGLHFAVNESPTWTWTTIWWHDAPDGQFGYDRDPAVKDVWKNYRMNVVYDYEVPWENGRPKVGFNPYLEAEISDGLRSNCVSCHSRASWPEPDALPTLVSNGDCAFFHNTVAMGREAAGATYFPDRNEVLSLDSVWGLSALKQDTFCSLSPDAGLKPTEGSGSVAKH